MTQAKQILQLNRFDSSTPNLDERTQAMVAQRFKAFGNASVLFYQQPLEIIRAQGTYMYDRGGKAYLDLYNNVPCVGHCHPEVAAAIAEQAAILATNSRYLYQNLNDYAEALLATFPPELSNLVLTCTGSEANDIALRIAAMHSGGTGIVVTQTAYHGNTSAVMAVSPSSYRKGTPLPAHVRTIREPSSFQLSPDGDMAAAFAAELQAAIDDMAEHGIRFAGLLIDTIFSSDGVFADPPGFLQQALKIVHANGGLLIADEVQPGFGRTGEGHWCFARHGIVPDVVTLGKPMGNGYPMGGVITRPELLDTFVRETGYFNTFGANPVAAAAGHAVLKVLQQERLIENAGKIGQHLRNDLRRLAEHDSRIADVRGAGLFIGVELVDAQQRPDSELASWLINALKDEGILIGAAGAYGNVLKIRPALCFNQAQSDQFIETLQRLLARY